MTNKTRVFIAARKRGISADAVRAALAKLGAPPCLSEVGERRETYDRYVYREDGLGTVPCSRRVAGDERDCSRYQADYLVDLIVHGRLLDLLAETCPVCGDNITGQGGWCGRCDG